MPIRPEFRLIFYKPRSVDATETTVLVPTGSLHSDSFQLTTEENPPAGWKPYLTAPAGRRGRHDPLTKRLDTGELTALIVDRNLSAGMASNLKRWLTNFMGDAYGRPQLLGLKALWRVSYDGGVTFADYFTGRVSNMQLATRESFRIVTRDNADDLSSSVFTGRPHSSITYASASQVLPFGLPLAYGPIKAVAPLTGLMATVNGQRVINVDGASKSNPANLLTTSLASSGMFRSSVGIGSSNFHLAAQADPDTRVKITGGAVTGKEAVPSLMTVMVRPGAPASGGGGPTSTVPNFTFGVTQIVVQNIDDVTDPYYTDLAALADGTAVSFSVVKHRQSAVDDVTGETPDAYGANKDAPLFIADIHPCQLIKDLLDGKFGELKVGGVVVRSFPYDATALNALIADTSIPLMRFVIEKPYALNEFVEKQILVPNQLAWRLDEQGQVVVYDLRPTGSLPTSTPATDDDLYTDGNDPAWSVDRDSAITRFSVTNYIDLPVGLPEYATGIVDVPPTGVSVLKRRLNVRDFGNPDLGEKSMAIDALGIRACPGETVNGRDRFLWSAARALLAIEQYRGPYGSGPMRVRVKMRLLNRDGTKTAFGSLNPGQWLLSTMSFVPDPVTNLRGGARLFQVLERSEEGLGVWLDLLDAGPNSVLVAPTGASYAAYASDALHGVQVALTLNASSDPAVVWINVTSTSVGAVPAANDANWHPALLSTGALRATASGTLVIRGLPSGKRIWMRFRSEPSQSSQTRLPSAWAFPAGAGFVDTTALTAPTTFTRTVTTLRLVQFTWSNAGDNNSFVQILMCSPSGGTLEHVALLSPGSTTYTITGLDTLAGPDVTIAVRHIDQLGGSSADLTSTFTPAGAASTAPNIAGVVLIAGTP